MFLALFGRPTRYPKIKPVSPVAAITVSLDILTLTNKMVKGTASVFCISTTVSSTVIMMMRMVVMRMAVSVYVYSISDFN
jgi:hypothetical protein